MSDELEILLEEEDDEQIPVEDRTDDERDTIEVFTPEDEAVIAADYEESGIEPEPCEWTTADDEAFYEAFDKLAKKHPELIDPDYVPLPRHAATYSILGWSKWAGEKLNPEDLVFGTEDNAVVEHGTKNILNSRAKGFKTTFMLRLLCSVAIGKTLIPGFDVPMPGAVLYLHAELGNNQIARRSRSAIKDLRPKYDAVLDRYYYEAKDVNFSLMPTEDGIESRGQELIRKQVETMLKRIGPNRRLTVILDPLQNLIVGGDDNSTQAMSPCGHFIDGLIQKHGITVFLVTHAGKEFGKGIRGTSFWNGWYDTLITLDREEGASEVKISVKPRWGEPLDDFYMEFQDGTLVMARTPGKIKLNGKNTHDQILEFLQSKGQGVKVTTPELRTAVKKAWGTLRIELQKKQNKGTLWDFTNPLSETSGELWLL